METDDGEVIAKGAVNAPLGSNAAMRLNAYYHYIDPLVENLSGPDLHGQRSYGVQGKLLFELGDATELLLTGNYSNMYSGNFGRDVSRYFGLRLSYNM